MMTSRLLSCALLPHERARLVAAGLIIVERGAPFDEPVFNPAPKPSTLNSQPSAPKPQCHLLSDISKSKHSRPAARHTLKVSPAPRLGRPPRGLPPTKLQVLAAYYLTLDRPPYGTVKRLAAACEVKARALSQAIYTLRAERQAAKAQQHQPAA